MFFPSVDTDSLQPELDFFYQFDFTKFFWVKIQSQF